MEENQRPDLGKDNIEYEDDEYLMKCVVDPAKRTFFLYSSEGDTKTVVCDTPDQFMNVLETCTTHLNKDQIEFADLSLKE